MKVDDSKVRNVRRMIEKRIEQHKKLLLSNGCYNEVYKETVKNQYMFIHTSLVIMLLLGVITKTDFQKYMKKVG
jgi:ribonuclease HIII